MRQPKGPHKALPQTTQKQKYTGIRWPESPKKKIAWMKETIISIAAKRNPTPEESAWYATARKRISELEIDALTSLE